MGCRPDLMASPPSTCPVCTHPILAGAYRILQNGDILHLACGASSDSVNQWPGGVRQLLCLNCGRAFDSASKVWRRCKACRAKTAS